MQTEEAKASISEESEIPKETAGEVDPGKNQCKAKDNGGSSDTTSPKSNELVVSVKMLYQTVLIASVACSLLTVFLYDRFFSTKIAVFDYPDFLVKMRNAAISGAISPDQMKSYMEIAEAKIKNQPRNYVVITGDVLLGDAKAVKRIVADVDFPKGSQNVLQQPAGAQNGSQLPNGVTQPGPQQQGLGLPQSLQLQGR